MKLSEIKQDLATAEALTFMLPDGSFVPSHFHVTEIGLVTKSSIDCGGTLRNEKAASFQLWSSNDTDHRLFPEKLMRIITLSEKVLGTEDLDIEVEYQTDTIGKYGLHFDGTNFMLTGKHTSCLASEHCGIPPEKQHVSLAQSGQDAVCCSPATGCC
jgi:hypothetical protein